VKSTETAKVADSCGSFAEIAKASYQADHFGLGLGKGRLRQTTECGQLPE